MRRWIIVIALASCEKRDPLFCGLNQTDPRCLLADGGGIPPGYVSIGGRVNVAGAGLVLLNNGGDDKPVSTGPFAFPTPIPMGATYDVTIGTSPTNPSQTCTVTNGSGTANDNVDTVQVDCTTATYTIGGTVIGCTGSCPTMLILTNNGEDLPHGNGAFTFPTPIASQSMYAVTVKPPTGPTCNVFGGMGTVGNANISSVVVNCAAGTFILSGTPPNGGAYGLAGSLMLHATYTNPVAPADTITVSTTSFAFPTPLANLQNFAVNVSAQPQYPPANQTCSMVMGASGQIVGADYPSVKVNCITNSFAVGGTVTGLNAGSSFVLRDNGGDDKMITANGAFTFATPIASGSTYAATAATQPPAELCKVTMGSGTIANGAVNSIVVACGDPGIRCGGAFCTPGAQKCCDPNGNPQCFGASMPCPSSGLSLPCDDAADCGANMRCCAMTHNGNGNVTSVACSSTCGGTNPVQLCDPGTSECASGSCSSYSKLAGDFACQ